MAGHRRLDLTRGDVPDLRRAVLAASHQRPAVAGELEALHAPAMGVPVGSGPCPSRRRGCGPCRRIRRSPGTCRPGRRRPIGSRGAPRPGTPGPACPRRDDTPGARRRSRLGCPRRRPATCRRARMRRTRRRPCDPSGSIAARVGAAAAGRSSGRARSISHELTSAAPASIRTAPAAIRKAARCFARACRRDRAAMAATPPRARRPGTVARPGPAPGPSHTAAVGPSPAPSS